MKFILYGMYVYWPAVWSPWGQSCIYMEWHNLLQSKPNVILMSVTVDTGDSLTDEDI